jgi:hypothetical protein
MFKTPFKTLYIYLIDLFNCDHIIMSSRKHESGASKRRAQKNKKEYEAKIPKLSNYFQPIENPIILIQADDTFNTNTNEVNII